MKQALTSKAQKCEVQRAGTDWIYASVKCCETAQSLHANISLIQTYHVFNGLSITAPTVFQSDCERGCLGGEYKVWKAFFFHTRRQKYKCKFGAKLSGRFFWEIFEIRNETIGQVTCIQSKIFSIVSQQTMWFVMTRVNQLFSQLLNVVLQPMIIYINELL